MQGKKDTILQGHGFHIEWKCHFNFFKMFLLLTYSAIQREYQQEKLVRLSNFQVHLV